MKQGVKRMAAHSVIGLLAVGIILCCTCFYVRNLDRNSETEVTQHLEEISIQSAGRIQERVNQDMTILHNIALSINEADGDLNSVSTLDVVETHRSNTNFSDIWIVDLDGRAWHTADQEVSNMAGQAYVQAGLKGKSEIVHLANGRSNNDSVVMSVPVIRRHYVVGVLVGRYDREKINNLLSVSTFQGRGYSYLVDQEGQVFIHSKHKDADPKFLQIQTDFVDSKFRDARAMDKMIKRIKDGDSGAISYKRNETERIMSYVPVGISDWYLLSVVPRALVTSKTKYQLEQTVFFVSMVLAALLLVTVYAFMEQRKSKKKLIEAQKSMKMNQQRYEVVMDQTEDTVFEWNYASHTIEASKNFFQKFGYRIPRGNFPNSLVEQGVFPTKDAEEFLAIFTLLELGEPYAEREVRVAKSDGTLIWCRIAVTAVREESGSLIRAIGLIADIDSQKARLLQVEEEARRDSMTMLYNKTAAKNLIEDYLNEQAPPSVLLLLDVDNFKGVNDTYGHLCGDEVLQWIAADLKCLFRSNEIVGRIGGDEFLIFCPDCGIGSALEQKIHGLQNSFSAFRSQSGNNPQVSVSIGASLFPKNGWTYESLFAKADQALYLSKSQGKNRCTFYSSKDCANK